jgi:hypothetical protein
VFRSSLSVRIGWLLVATFFALYVGTGVPWMDPLYSAPLVTGSLGLDVYAGPRYPVWQMVVGFIGWVTPAFALTRVLHFFNALLAAGAVGLLYAGWQMLPVFKKQRSGSGAAKVWTIQIGGGVVAALLLGFSFPFWFIATRVHPSTLAVVLFLAAGVAFLQLQSSRRYRSLYLFASLYAVGMLESPLFIWGLPIYAFLIRKQLRLPRAVLFRLFSAWGVAGFLTVLVLVSFQVVLQSRTGAGVDVAGIVRMLLSGPLREAVAYEVPVWSVVLLTGILPMALLIAYISLVTVPPRVDMGVMTIHVATTLLVIIHLFNLPPSLWPVLGPAPMTVFMCLLGAVMGGYLVISWGLLMTSYCMMLYRKRHLKALYAIRSGTAIFVIALAAMMNGKIIWSERVPVTKSFLDEILDGLSGREWVVADGVFDSALRVRAWEQGHRVRVLNLQSPVRSADIAALANVWEGHPDEVERNSEWSVVLHAWMANDRLVHQKLVTLSWSALWEAHGYYAQPEGAFYGGIPVEEASNGSVFVPQTAVAAPVGAVRTSRHERPDAHWLRRHRARLWNDYGVALQRSGQQEEGMAAYRRARELDSANLAAWINLLAAVAESNAAPDAISTAGLRAHVLALPRETMTRGEWDARFGQLYRVPPVTTGVGAEVESALRDIRSVYARVDVPARVAADKALAIHLLAAREARVGPDSLRGARASSRSGSRPAPATRGSGRGSTVFQENPLGL